MPAFHRVRAQIETSQIATEAITFDKARFHIETASGTLPPGTRYRSFTTAFGTPPEIAFSIPGTTARMAAGTFVFRVDFDRVRPGSFRWRGTPAVRATFRAWGYR